jgi:hypothetical protein
MEAEDLKLFRTKRSELLALYAKNNVPFLATTRGLHSVRSLRFDVENLDAGGAIGFLVAHAGQELDFFNYAQGNQIDLAGSPNFRATEAETSLTTARRTTASADLSVEWITMGARGLKAQYTPAAATPLYPDFVAAVNPTAGVTEGLSGQACLADPFALVLPPEVGSSATLEQVLYHLVAPHLTLRFEWDNADRTEKMGTCDQFVEGGGASYLHANGEPSVNNRFRIPEGFLWAREGQPAGDMHVIATLRNNVVIPYSPPASLLSTGFPDLIAAWVEIKLRVGGMLLRVPGSN